MRRGLKRRFVQGVRAAIGPLGKKIHFLQPGALYRRKWSTFSRRKRRPFKNPGKQVLSYRKDTVFPQRLRCKLAYSDCVNVTTIGGIDDYILRGNGPFDPDFTGVGSQPVGYDELSGIYHSYRVYASKVEVAIDNNLENEPITVAIVPEMKSTARTDVDAAVCMPNSVHCMVASDANKMEYLTNFMTTKCIRGLNDITADHNQRCLTTTVPDDGWWWHIMVQSANQSDNNAWIFFKITYYMEFFNLKQLEMS